MHRANEESYDSPFLPHGKLKPNTSTKVIKQRLCGGISAESPTYFHLQHVNVLDYKSRTQELFKGYKLKEKNDYKLVRHPELIPQERKYFSYEDYNNNRSVGSKAFDYSTMKPSNIIDLLADKRPDFKMSSNFYKRYNEKLTRDGFGIARGIFTVESNQRHKFGTTLSSRLSKLEKFEKDEMPSGRKSAKLSNTLQNHLITDQAKALLPVQLRAAKGSMKRFLSSRQNCNFKITKAK